VTRVAWVDASVGAAGDMLLGALLDAGVPEATVVAAIAAVGVPVTLSARRTDVGGLSAVQVSVGSAEADPPRRTWADIRTLIEAADLDAGVRALALEVFRRLAEAEGAVHGTPAEDVHFHEVGAHDAVADVVGAAAGFLALDAEEVHVSPVALGGGGARTEHGQLPVPAPAVLAILRAARAPAYGGPLPVELCTPTGAAILASVATRWGAMPAMQVESVGVGAGSRRLPDRPNVVRIVLGEAASAPAEAPVEELLLATNVDDLDPRLWPGVLTGLLAAGAADAWLTPIVMKKGRPAHTVTVLVAAARAEAVRRVLFTETSAIGLREQRVGKRALARECRQIAVDGEQVRVKIAMLDGVIVNAAPEYEDVAAAAQRLGRPVKAVLAAAVAAADDAGLTP